MTPDGQSPPFQSKMAGGPRRAVSKPLLDARAAAVLLSVKPSWVYEAVRTGQLPHVKIGRHIRFLQSDLEDYIDRQRRLGRAA